MINKNLEQQAQELFKAWFVTFEAFGGEMPSSLEAAKLGDIASIKTNRFSPTKNPTVMLEHYSIPAFDEQKYPIFELASNVKSNKYILTNNSVMISKLNPNTKRVWRPMCISEFAVSSTEFIIFEANDPTYKDFVFRLLTVLPFLIGCVLIPLVLQIAVSVLHQARPWNFRLHFQIRKLFLIFAKLSHLCTI